jgi:hypothetical protein
MNDGHIDYYGDSLESIFDEKDMWRYEVMS